MGLEHPGHMKGTPTLHQFYKETFSMTLSHQQSEDTYFPLQMTLPL